ncbi:G-D-S-L family lipolytic protein [Galbibacter orientalis]|uniref:G-D-S-L family lipolytic protein n=1 Tax=Galbibacter orientalis TaxID=453852 RepID=UPI00308093FF
MKKLLYISIAAIALTSCQPEFNDPVDEQGFYSSGDADFSNFVAVGNSLTAGYADGALYLNGQQNSFPSMLAIQFKHVGGGDFTQPLVNDNFGGLLANGNQITDNRRVIVLGTDGSQTPEILDGTPTTDISNVLEGPFNNMGVPGSKIFHLVANGYGNIANLELGAANPYFVRMASTTDASIIEDAASQNPTFFSLWIGNNDILSYATSGGIGVDQSGNLDPTTYGENDITDPNVFAKVYNDLLTALTNGGAKGVVANIPNVTTIPYFTTVPYNAIPLDAQTAGVVNQAYAQYNGGLLQAQSFGLITAEEVAQRTIQFSAGQNAVVILDEDLTDLTGINPGLTNMRQATAEDLLPLTTSSILGTLADPNNPQSIIGVAVPLTDGQALTATEIEMVTNAQTAYNTTIEALATQYDLAFVDVEALMNQLANGGISFDGGNITNTFATGGAFSLDGVHPTQRGYAVIANQIINAINEKYNATIPALNPGAYPTIFVK